MVIQNKAIVFKKGNAQLQKGTSSVPPSYEVLPAPCIILSHSSYNITNSYRKCPSFHYSEGQLNWFQAPNVKVTKKDL